MMNGKMLLDMGWPEGPVIGLALRAAATMAAAGLDEAAVLARLGEVATAPEMFTKDALLGPVADAWVRLKTPLLVEQLREEPIDFACWGAHLVDANAVEQMRHAARLPIARAGALMPDGHWGYGLPIGGVLATENAVIPYGVGVDIACRMRLSVFEVSPYLLDQKRTKFEKALLDQTRFGTGGAWRREDRANHPVMDDADWMALPLLRALKDRAWAQLGTSGSGNHFVEFGSLVLAEAAPDLGLKAGKYVALLSHSGSRGVGATIANTFTAIAREHHPTLEKSVQHLAWLDLDSADGQEYWLAMELAGRYAAANHAVIHERVAEAVRLTPVAVVENHHNFAWKETLPDGTPVVVHRKGATPAGEGVLGVIPGSMSDSGYVVRGKGVAAALNSASHGAGRRMGRREAMRRISADVWKKHLRERQITLLGGSLDESPQAYKPIEEVMAAQTDLVDVVGVFTPRLVRMAEESGSD